VAYVSSQEDELHKIVTNRIAAWLGVCIVLHEQLLDE
jgi:hypothetical protein